MMLTIPTLEKLRELKFHGMARAFEQQQQTSQYAELSFEERLGLIVDCERMDRENRRLKARLMRAKIRQQACLEDIDYSAQRGLDKSLLQSLASCQWIGDHLNLLIDGATGTGKSFIAAAFANKACREGFDVLCFRAPRLFEELALAHGDGRYPKMMNQIARASLIIIDDWGLSKITDSQQCDFLEILEDRHNIHSTIIASQIPSTHWHERMDNPTVADAILDRLIHNAYKISLKGESIRKKKSKLTKPNLTVK
jgi:DNA replication protein DnaC